MHSSSRQHIQTLSINSTHLFWFLCRVFRLFYPSFRVNVWLNQNNEMCPDK